MPRLIFYTPGAPPGPAEKELTELPSGARGEVKNAMKDLRDRGTAQLKVCRDTGPVLCVEVPLEQHSVHVFYTQLPSRPDLVVLHVASTNGCCPEDGFSLAQSRREDVPE